MKSLRQWQLDSVSPFSPQLAADARLSQTYYHDDQVWEVSLSQGETPALSLQTGYGGRAGLASIVPMWLHEGRVIYQAQAYVQSPRLTAFAPGYFQFTAAIAPQLEVIAEYWAIESHALGGRYTITNNSQSEVTLRLDLLGFIGIGGKEQKLLLLPAPNGGAALGLGKVGNLEPAVVLEGAKTDPTGQLFSSKIGRDIVIESTKTITVRWVHAGLTSIENSIALAQKWLAADWDAAFSHLAAAAQSIPQIETGNPEWDAAIAFSYQQLVQAFLKPTSKLPQASFVAVRGAGNGFSARGDGGDHQRSWAGQTPVLAYPVGLGIASVDAGLAQGIIRNYLAVQKPDGWIDWKPGLGGQRQGILCLPILARLAWGIFQYTEDDVFLREVFPGLLKFLERWLMPDLDADGDGLPEWQSENQTGYVFMPTFAGWQSWGQGADIRLVETPDVAAYLLSEAKSLHEIAFYLHDKASQAKLDEHIIRLQSLLETLWKTGEKRYSYRDRDTHTITGSVNVVEDARGNDEIIPAERIDPPNRLIIQVSGGMDLSPRMTVRLDGFDATGETVSETITNEAFVWSHGRGVATSHSVFSQVDRATFDGLSRVYRVDIDTLDTTRLDINMLLPLWSAGIEPDRADEIIRLLTDTECFWRANGVTMNPATDVNFDPSNMNGSGGVWPFWNMLLGEGLIEYGALEQATDLVKRLLTVQSSALKQDKAFAEFYHSDEAIGLGEHGNINGLVPLHLLLRVIGIRIISAQKVWTGGPFLWETPVTVRQHGVTVTRQADGTHIKFPSGYVANLPVGEWQAVIDPTSESSE